MRADHSQVQLRYFSQPLPGFDVTTTLYHNGFSRNWYKLQSVGGHGIAAVLASPEAFPAELAILRGADSDDGALRVRANNRGYFSRGVQTTFGLRFGGMGAAHDVEVGVRYHQDQEDRFQHEDAFRMSGGRMALTSAGAPGSQANRVSDAAAWALHVQDRIVLGALTLTPGVRYETIDFARTDYRSDDPGRAAAPSVRENAASALIPGLGVKYTLRPSLRLFGGVHRGFGAPGPGADRSTEPELSVNYELGARLRRGRGEAQLVGFFSDYQNILGASTLATGTEGTGDLFNGGAVEVRGVEASAGYDALAGRGAGVGLPLRFAYTFTDAAFRTSFQSQYEPWGEVSAGDALPYLARHQLYGSLALVQASRSVRLGARYAGAMRTTAGQGPIPPGDATDAFLVFDLSAEHTIAARGTLVLGVENLTDRRYVAARRPAGARPALPRTLQIGLRFSH